MPIDRSLDALKHVFCISNMESLLLMTGADIRCKEWLDTGQPGHVRFGIPQPRVSESRFMFQP